MNWRISEIMMLMVPKEFAGGLGFGIDRFVEDVRGGFCHGAVLDIVQVNVDGKPPCRNNSHHGVSNEQLRGAEP